MTCPGPSDPQGCLPVGSPFGSGGDTEGMSGCSKAQGWKVVEGGSWAGHAHRGRDPRPSLEHQPQSLFIGKRPGSEVGSLKEMTLILLLLFHLSAWLWFYVGIQIETRSLGKQKLENRKRKNTVNIIWQPTPKRTAMAPGPCLRPCPFLCGCAYGDHIDFFCIKKKKLLLFLCCFANWF